MSSQPHKPDFHVVALNYDIEHDSTVSYDNPEPIEFANAIAVFRLNSGSLRCELKQHFDDPAKACELIEPTLRAWELDADLRYGRNQLRFKFRNSDVIDRSPVLPETIRGYAMMGGVGGFGILGTATVHLTKKRYPEPPTTFAITPIVKTIASRFQRYQDGNEPLPAMAYFFALLSSRMTRAWKT